MHGVHAPEGGRLSVLQTPRRENQQKRDGRAQNGLESICDGHCGMAILLLLYLVGVYQGALTEDLTGALPLPIAFFSLLRVGSRPQPTASREQAFGPPISISPPNSNHTKNCQSACLYYCWIKGCFRESD